METTDIILKEEKNYIKVDEAKNILENIYLKEKDKEYEDRSLESKLFNKFSGGYWSPTFVKSFMNCPARCFMESLLPRTESPLANVGSCTHSIFEELVKIGMPVDAKKAEKVTLEKIEEYSISESYIPQIKEYVRNFYMSKDYLNMTEKFPWNREDISLFPEAFYSQHINKLGVDLGDLFTLIDRIDIRKEGVYIIDYKTGDKKYYNPTTYVENYVNQFIAYKWMVEEQFGIEVAGAYVMYPGFNDNRQYIEMPINSLKRQSMLIEKVKEYYDFISEQNKKGVFYETINDGCKYCKFKSTCNKYNKTEDQERDLKFIIGNLK